jgi:nucleotide-binding universal stress UspA family protein
VVVGVDPSPAAQAALAVGLEEARLRHAELHVVHAWHFPADMASSAGASGTLPPMEEMRNWAEEVLDDALAAVGIGADVTVIRDVPNGPAAPALERASRGAELLVVGTRGHSRLSGLFLGSVSQYLVVHAACPVLVVHGPRSWAEITGQADEEPGGASTPTAAAGAIGPATDPAATDGTGGSPRVLEVIPEEECLALLAGQEVGRLALVRDGAPVVIPVDYTLDDRTVVVRTDPGTILDWAALGRVAVEVDVIDPDSHEGWNVLVQGVGRDITDGVDTWSGRVRNRSLAPWVEGDKAHWIAVVSPTVTGRRIRAHVAAPAVPVAGA